MQFKNTRAFSDVQDKADHLYMFRKEFLIPKRDSKQIIYLCGNSGATGTLGAKIYTGTTR